MAKTRKRNVRAKRTKQYKLCIVAISGVLLILGGVLFVDSIPARGKKQEQEKRIAELEQMKEAEEAEAEELDELEEYVGTKQYIEDVAKDKLGLVYENEILFEAEP